MTRDQAEYDLEVMRLLPEIDQIEDPELSAAVREIWVECWAESRWSSLESVPKSVKLPAQHTLVGHTRSVAQMAMAVAETIERNHGISFDRDMLLATALLHDVSMLLENEPADDGESARRARLGDLMQHGAIGAFKALARKLPEDLAHNILVHTRASRVMPQTWEAIIVHYVDYLDTDALFNSYGLDLLIVK